MSVAGPVAELDMVAMRLGLATLVGAAIGVNRDLHGQPIGLRTLSIVGLGGAAVVLLCADLSTDGAAPHPDAISRVLQGILTGIGFLGAGVILRSQDGSSVHGLTTAATIWLTAVLGVACGLGAFRVVAVASVVALVVLTLGGPLEKRIHRRLVDKDRTPHG